MVHAASAPDPESPLTVRPTIQAQEQLQQIADIGISQICTSYPSQPLVSVPVTRYSLTLWGQSSQPEAVRAWAFPLAFRDYASGQRIAPTFENSHWRRRRYEDLHYPVPFELRFDAQLVTCMEVRAALCKRQQVVADGFVWEMCGPHQMTRVKWVRHMQMCWASGLLLGV